MIVQEKQGYDFQALLSNFQVDGKLLSIERFSTGHINETYLSHFETSGGTASFIHQRINHFVFKEPEKVMANIERVTRHARRKLIDTGGDPDRGTLNIVPTLSGGSFCKDESGNYWRTYHRIQGARTYDQVENVRHVYSAAHAFGTFQRLVADLPGERLFETIPDFHNTPRRYEAFVRAVEADTVNRAISAKAEIDFIQNRQAALDVIVDGLAEGSIPERITHNDTKFNNVMIDDQTGQGVCVIDLDTVMPGSILYDFGDAVRLGAGTAAEDETDLSKVTLDMNMFRRLASGYLDATRGFLTSEEIGLLAFSARLLALELGIRFLTDYLQGDQYFRIHRQQHNLDRARTQLKMTAEIERVMDSMQAVVDDLAYKN